MSSIERGRDLYRATKQGDQEARARLAPPVEPPAPVPTVPADVDPVRAEVVAQFAIRPEHACLIVGGTREEMATSAREIRSMGAAGAYSIPLHAPNPGQVAGNVEPERRHGGLDSGRELYRNQRPTSG